ncbi:MAG: SIR2 family protein [Acidimicrobiaceae bacterium]|nr:SIR2 family protein [Acidimicrobiaceae bacterium]
MSNTNVDGFAEMLDSGERVLLGDLDCSEGDAIPKRTKVEPYLAALLQVEHLNLLVGAGLSMGLVQKADNGNIFDMSKPLQINDNELKKSIKKAARRSAQHTARGKPNLEDYLRIAISAAEGLNHINEDAANILQKAIDDALEKIYSDILRTEYIIHDNAMSTTTDGHSTRSLLTSFLASFAGRNPTRDRLHIFTTNYDRILEWGAELLGLRIIDRFVGSLNPVFRSSQAQIDYFYSPLGSVRDPRHLDGVFRLTKLHGSVDWIFQNSNKHVIRYPLPFAAYEHSSPPDALESAGHNSLIIYPNAAKDLETTYFPFADLFRDFSAALCRPHSALVTYGYSFGDSHINRIIEDMLTIPSTHLLIISYDDKMSRIAQFVNSHHRSGQISLMLGHNMADLESLVDKWLPRPSSEFLLKQAVKISQDRGIAFNTSESDRHEELL